MTALLDGIQLQPRVPVTFTPMTPIPPATTTTDDTDGGPPVGTVHPRPPLNPLTNEAGMLITRPRYRLCCKATANNVIMTFTKPNGCTICWVSGGSTGHKGVNQAEFEAGYQCTTRIFAKIVQVAKQEETPILLDILIKGFGQGRTALQSVLASAEGAAVREMVHSITDRTPIKIGGTRAKKARRL